MKFSLTLRQNFPFAQNPGLVELEGDKILCNDVNLPKAIDPDNSYNPHNVRMWVIGHEFGAICAVFADCEQDAMDAAVDAGMLDCFMAETQDYEGDIPEGLAHLGNASELFDLSYAWMGEVEFDAARDIHLIVKLVRAAEAGADNLG